MMEVLATIKELTWLNLMSKIRDPGKLAHTLDPSLLLAKITLVIPKQL